LKQMRWTLKNLWPSWTSSFIFGQVVVADPRSANSSPHQSKTLSVCPVRDQKSF
jgi:hypothetical protein